MIATFRRSASDNVCIATTIVKTIVYYMYSEYENVLVGEVVAKLVESKVYSKIRAFLIFLMIILPRDMYFFSRVIYMSV